MKNILLLLLWFYSFHILAQNQLPQFSGKIIDKTNGEELPFATIQAITYAGFGSVSNSQGEFSFSGKETWSDTLDVRVSYLGYESAVFTLIAGLYQELALNESVKELREIIILPDDFVLDVLREVINRIPSNYPDRHERIQAVTVEQTFLKPDREDLLYRATAEVQADIFSYANKRHPVNIEVLSKEVDVTALYYDKMLGISVVAGAHNLQRFDLVAQRSGPFDLKNLTRYDFEIIDTLSFDNEQFAVISFSQNKEFEGKVFVNTEDYGIKKVEVDIFDFRSELYQSINRQNFDPTRRNFQISTEYLRYPDGRYRFQYAYYNTYFVYTSGRTFFLENIFTLQEFERGILAIPFTRQADYNSSLVDFAEIFASRADTTNISQILISNDSLIQETITVNPALLKTALSLRKLKWRWSMAGAFQTWDAQNINFQEPIGYQYQLEANERLVPLVGYSLSYPVFRRMELFYALSGSLQQQRYHRYELGLESTFNLTKTNSIRWIMGTGIGRQRMGMRLPTLIPDEEFSIGRRTFDSEEVNVFSRQRELVLTPRLGLAIKARPNRYLILKAEWPISLAADQGLYFLETNQGFFRRRARAYQKDEGQVWGGQVPIGLSLPILSLSY